MTTYSVPYITLVRSQC